MKTLFLLLPVLFLFGCKKDSLTPNDQLPDPYNTEKKNVFGCKLNGEVWLPGRHLFAITFFYNEFTGDFSMGAKIDDGEIYEGVSFTLAFKDTGIYDNKRTVPFVDLTGNEAPNWDSRCAEFFRDSTRNHFVHIKELDTQNGIIIGSFEDNGISPCGDTVIITDGRFKVTYK